MHKKKNSPYGINFVYEIIPLKRDIPQGKTKNYSGFSFLETVISVFLISIGMIAVVGLMASALREITDSRDQVIATLLSQEGVELVRNLRDNNWVNNKDSFDGFPGSSRSDCRIDSTAAAIYCGSSSFILRLGAEGDSTYQNLYSYNHGDNTRFQRKLFINYKNNMAEITSIVVWGASFPALSDCNSASKCAYTKTTLGRWGGN